MSALTRISLLLALLWLPLCSHAFEKIRVAAIFATKAIVEIDGKQCILILNQPSPEGVTLVATNTKEEIITIEVDGARRELRLAAIMRESLPQDTSLSLVNLWANSDGFFYADGSINNYPVRFLIDTGANTIALSSREAKRIGLDYSKGQRGVATTASGIATVYRVRLDKVKVGGIVLTDIDAAVIEGAFPKEILLGMSFLQRLDMKREGERLELNKRF